MTWAIAGVVVSVISTVASVAMSISQGKAQAAQQQAAYNRQQQQAAIQAENTRRQADWNYQQSMRNSQNQANAEAQKAYDQRVEAQRYQTAIRQEQLAQSAREEDRQRQISKTVGSQIAALGFAGVDTAGSESSILYNTGYQYGLDRYDDMNKTKAKISDYAISQQNLTDSANRIETNAQDQISYVNTTNDEQRQQAYKNAAYIPYFASFNPPEPYSPWKAIIGGASSLASNFFEKDPFGFGIQSKSTPADTYSATASDAAHAGLYGL